MNKKINSIEIKIVKNFEDLTAADAFVVPQFYCKDCDSPLEETLREIGVGAGLDKYHRYANLVNSLLEEGTVKVLTTNESTFPYLFHAVVMELSDQCPKEILQKCVFRILQYHRRIELVSLAMPLIGAAPFGKMKAETAIKSIFKSLADYQPPFSLSRLSLWAGDNADLASEILQNETYLED